MHLLQHTGEARFSLVALMNFVDFQLYNGSAASIDNVNGGGVDVPAGDSVTATMTNTELLTYCQNNGAAAIQVGATAAEKAAIVRTILSEEGAVALYDLEPDAFDNLGLDRAGSPLFRESPRSIHGLR